MNENTTDTGLEERYFETVWKPLMGLRLDSLDSNVSPETFGEKVSALNKTIEAFIAYEITSAKQTEHQFFLNILDGTDLADKELGVEGGTLAIRHALKSRFLGEAALETPLP